MRRKAELMKDTLRGVARTDDGNVVRHASFDAGPGTNDGAAGHEREQVRQGGGAFAELVPIELGAVFVAKRTPKMAAPDQDRTVGELLEGELATSQYHHWCNEGWHWRGDHQHGRDHLQWHRLSDLCGDAISPGPGRIDDVRCFEPAVRGLEPPGPAVASQIADRYSLQKTRSEGNGLAAKGLRGAKGIGSPVTPRDNAANAMLGGCGNDLPQLRAIEQFFVPKSAQA